MNGDACKINGVSASETSKFECIIAENAKVRKHVFREILTQMLWPFIRDYKFIA
jgi:hypothetical protein